MISLVRVPRVHSRKRIRMALEFFAERLMGKRLAKSVFVEVTFVKGMTDRTGDYGLASWEDRPHRPREFAVLVDRDLKEDLLLRTLAHEMVHVKQHAKGELTSSLRNANLSRWHDEVVDDRVVKYRSLPWEKEAFSLEKVLVKEFKQHEAKASEA